MMNNIVTYIEHDKIDDNNKVELKISECKMFLLINKETNTKP